ncbi:hypothetical protein QJS04_geneDACA005737 [Acorus gramineus]|uniref:Uncharacterized protein n=1 Tax=Acorus gramineus TaxID=55184 RepID=A0AAV9BJ62_ACOGR|nr:hypothetical protein QJS04_geneDACA005737 [Acorus gramineus]
MHARSNDSHQLSNGTGILQGSSASGASEQSTLIACLIEGLMRNSGACTTTRPPSNA